MLAVLVGGALTLQGLGPPAPDRSAPRAPAPAPPVPTYASQAPDAASRPRVVLVIDGVGLDENLSERLIRALPSAVDLAFSAYTPDEAADRLRRTADATGHECLLSIPMEPAGYPLAEEGIRALAASAGAARNRDNLSWALARVPRCIGATGASDGLAGERFAASGPSFDAMLHTVRSRGLLYLDPRPEAPVSDDPGLRHADLVLDRTASPAEPVTAALLTSRLAALEQIAKSRGVAIGLAGPPLPVLLDRLQAWARALPDRGLVLVPLSSLSAGSGSTGSR